MIAQVLVDGPASKGGVRVGDVILQVNDRPVILASDLPHLVGVIKPGDKAQFQVLREGKRVNLELKVGNMPVDGQESPVTSAAEPEQASNRLGVAVVSLTPEQRKELDIQNGVLVKAVSQGPAAMIGLRPGDVITHLNNLSISSVDEFHQVVKQLPDNRSVSMRVLREGRASFITFKLTE